MVVDEKLHGIPCSGTDWPSHQSINMMDLTSSLPTTQYIFPILRHSDILQCMSELNIELTKAELAEPARHKDRVRKVFLLLLDTCCGITEEDLNKLSPKMSETLQEVSKFPQLHTDFESVRLFLHVKKCMRICGVYDFGLKDFFIPTPKRFRIQLSAAINLAKFREDQLKLYAELNEPVSALNSQWAQQTLQRCRIHMLLTTQIRNSRQQSIYSELKSLWL